MKLIKLIAATIFIISSLSFSQVGYGTDLTGSVASSYDGSAVEGATVAIDTFMTITDATGNFTILDIPEGEWEVMFHAPGFYDYLDSAVVIVVDSTTTLDIAMDPKMPEVVIDAPAEGETIYERFGKTSKYR